MGALFCINISKKLKGKTKLESTHEWTDKFYIIFWYIFIGGVKTSENHSLKTGILKLEPLEKKMW